MTPALARLASVICAAALACVALLGCQSGDTAPEELVDTTVVIQLTTGSNLRGLSMSWTAAAGFTVLSVNPASLPLTTGTCQANFATGDVDAACVTTTNFGAPLAAWAVSLRHPTSTDAVDGVDGLACEGSDSTGATFAVTCAAVAP